jgi:ABC-type multidrug transport system fused ATPase/permease subunit
MSGIKWLGSYFSKYPVKTIFVMVVAVVEIVLFMFPITITADIIQIALDGGGLSQISDKIWFLLGLALVQATIFFSISFTNEVLAHRITTDITQDLFESLQFRSLTYHDTKDVGEIMARATGDTRTINIALSPGVRIILSIITVWILNLIIIFTIDIRLGFIGVVVLFIFLITAVKYSKSLSPLSLSTREEFGHLSKDTDNYFTGIREIKGFVSEIWAKRKFAHQCTKLREKEIKEGKKAAWFYPMGAVVLYAGITIVFSLYLAFQPNSGVSIADVVKIAGYITLLVGISQEIGWAMEFLVRSKAGTDRIYEIINESDLGVFKAGNDDLSLLPAVIEFRNVSFRYRSDLPYALKDISFKVEENQTIAIVGGPGSGKSTITKLIQRLYLPIKGSLLLGGKPIQEFSSSSIRKNIAMVEQDIFLFNKTVRDNIRFGNPSASHEEVVSVAKLAQAHEFILQLPQQYDNIVGEKGVKLSGGQAQRLSIARALLVNPRILIMDDGASALDARTEILIQDAIQSILKTHTTIITTHRLSIISHVDLVLIVDHGQLVGMGTHSQLIRSNHYYRRLFEHHYELPPLEIGSEYISQK